MAGCAGCIKLGIIEEVLFEVIAVEEMVTLSLFIAEEM